MFNFNWGTAAGIGTCSHCFHPASTDSGARTTTFEKMFYDEETVPRRIRYQKHFKAILYDLDGTLTGMGPNSWATPFYEHMDQPGCRKSEERHAGAVCDNSVTIRRIAFHGMKPKWRFDN